MRAGVFCLAKARWQAMFSQMGLEIWIKWTSIYLDAQSLDDALLPQSARGGGVQRQWRRQRRTNPEQLYRPLLSIRSESKRKHLRLLKPFVENVTGDDHVYRSSSLRTSFQRLLSHSHGMLSRCVCSTFSKGTRRQGKNLHFKGRSPPIEGLTCGTACAVCQAGES